MNNANKVINSVFRETKIYVSDNTDDYFVDVKCIFLSLKMALMCYIDNLSRVNLVAIKVTIEKETRLYNVVTDFIFEDRSWTIHTVGHKKDSTVIRSLLEGICSYICLVD